MSYRPPIKYKYKSNSIRDKLTPKERVAWGIKSLEKHGPKGWRDKLLKSRIDFSHPSRAILGVLYGQRNWTMGLYKLKIVGWGAYQGLYAYAMNKEDQEALAVEWERALRTDKKWITLRVICITRIIKGLRYNIYQTDAVEWSLYQGGNLISKHKSLDAAKRKALSL